VRLEIVSVILGMAVVTFLPRFLPMALLSRWTIPEKLRWGLEYIPVAILSAIVFPILLSDGRGIPGVQWPFLIAAVPTFIFAWRVRSLWGSVILGMAIYWVLGFFL